MLERGWEQSEGKKKLSELWQRSAKMSSGCWTKERRRKLSHHLRTAPSNARFYAMTFANILTCTIPQLSVHPLK